MSGVRNPSRKSFPPNLYLDKNGYFSYRNPVSGKRKGIGKDKAVAFREARAANAVLATMTPSSLVTWVSGKDEHSLISWIPVYKKRWEEKTKPAVATLRMATYYLKKIVAADFSWMNLRDITAAHIAAFVNNVETVSGHGAAIGVRGRLSDMFRSAEIQGLIESGKNPVAPTYKPDTEVKRERLSLEQFLLIRSHSAEYLRNAMDLALMTAQRREDICEAKFTDYRDGNLFVIQGKSQGRVRLQLSGSIRLDAVNMSIADVIKQCRDDVLSPWIIHHVRSKATARPGDQISLNGLSSKFTRAREIAGITPADGRTGVSFHEIRSLSERLYRKQYGAEFAQAILGHKNAKMTATYDDLRGSGWQVVAVK